MRRKVKRSIILFMFIMMIIGNISYVEVKASVDSPYGPKVEDLKSKEVVVNSFQDIKRIRGNLTTISIKESSTPEELNNTYKSLNYFIEEFNEIKKNLDNNIATHKDSFSDVFFSEQILFIAESYIISIRQQQNLIIALQEKKVDAQKLFYSSYLLSPYYYLNLGDQMVAYIDTYFVVV
ncbi:hypothetical protein ACQPVP_12610 [Clostridium nigeriense]|uniref:hypothetical protein n=1 Tax=Clostridium nigeriense TaxID=1805470 RepID=UPI003D342849